jgi:DNA-binding IclR family transcriptional regulator
MARKPIHLGNALNSRQAVWEAIRRLEAFTAREVRDETLLGMDTVRDYLAGLEAAGYISKEPNDAAGPTRWRLARDVGVEAPRVRRDGTLVTQGQGRENMWQAMRILRTFTARELAVAARTPDCMVQESTAAEYARHLHKAGYLSHRDGVYQMLPAAFTGPLAPMIQRTKRVWDPNQRQVRWQSDGEVDHDQ